MIILGGLTSEAVFFATAKKHLLTGCDWKIVRSSQLRPAA